MARILLGILPVALVSICAMASTESLQCPDGTREAFRCETKYENRIGHRSTALINQIETLLVCQRGSNDFVWAIQTPKFLERDHYAMVHLINAEDGEDFAPAEDVQYNREDDQWVIDTAYAFDRGARIVIGSNNSTERSWIDLVRGRGSRIETAPLSCTRERPFQR